MFGQGVSSKTINQKIQYWKECTEDIDVFLILAGSRTAELEGISAAGITAESRKDTAAADGELFLQGPSPYRKYPMPPLPAGISPALISYVASKFLKSTPSVIAIGLSSFPRYPHLQIETPPLGPSDCITTGRSMEYQRVKALWKKGFSMGLNLRRTLLITECVPGGTTTAQAVLTGLGVNVEGLIGGSLRNPPFALKRAIVMKGLEAADLRNKSEPEKILAAVGDPFQPFAAGLLLGAREVGRNVLLGGGSQMLAVLALALSSLNPASRNEFLEGLALATTSWLLEENSDDLFIPSSLIKLTNNIENFFRVGIVGFSSGLKFNNCKNKCLRDYEIGYIKEGVGAGALSFLAQLQGVKLEELITSCDAAADKFFAINSL